MATRIEGGKGWVLGEFDGWSVDDEREKMVVSGDMVHLGTRYDTASVVVKADVTSTRVTVFPGIRPISVETFGIVSKVPMVNSKRSKTMEFELKGADAFVQIAQKGYATEDLIIRVINMQDPIPLIYS